MGSKVTENNQNTDTDTEEDDFTNYFMQSANLYNIKDKVKEANRQLLMAEEVKNDKKTRVHFSIDLCEYEPEFDPNEQIVEDEIVEEPNYDNFSTENETDRDKTAENEEEIDEEILEITKNFDNLTKEDQKRSDFSEAERCNSKMTPSFRLDELIKKNHESANKKPKAQKKKSAPFRKKPLMKSQSINCEENCLELFHCSNDNNPCFFHDQPHLPILKLHRQCCQSLEKESKKSPYFSLITLPRYNGYHSEYGLTKHQLERKIQQSEKLIKLQQLRQMQLQRENDRKALENEMHFSTWLKRKLQQIKAERNVMKNPKKSQPKAAFNFRVFQRKHFRKVKPKSVLEKTVHITFPFRDDNGRIFRINIDKMIKTELSDGQIIKINVVLSDSLVHLSKNERLKFDLNQ